MYNTSIHIYNYRDFLRQIFTL